MNIKKKILLVTIAYPSRESHSNGTFTKELAQCLSSKYNITVLHCERLSKDSKNEPGIIIEKEQSIRIIHLFVKHSFIPWTLDIIIGFLKGLNHIQKEKLEIDLIHCNFFPSVIPFLFKFRKKLVILTEHWSGFPLKQLTKTNKLIAKIAINHCKVICPVSLFLMKSMQKSGISGNFKVIPNPIDMKIFYYKKKQQNCVVKILFVGRQIPERNTPIILKAIKEISKEFTNFHLDIVGGGSHLEQYEKLCNKLELKKFVTFHGQVVRSNIIDYIHSADFVLIPAGTETQSVFLNEAMACGKPILAANTGGPTEYVNEDIGILIDPKNIDEWKNGIMSMINKLNEFDPIKISQTARDNFSYISILKKYQEIYENLKD
jgi:glycosyltransferase involved in cell wall biosynthesis